MTAGLRAALLVAPPTRLVAPPALAAPPTPLAASAQLMR